MSSDLHLRLRAAVDKADGNQSKFAAAIGTSQQLVSDWLKRERPLPAEYVLPAEAAGFGSRHELRPDLFPVAEPYAAGEDASPEKSAPESPSIAKVA